jgi:hypothetical protein
MALEWRQNMQPEDSTMSDIYALAKRFTDAGWQRRDFETGNWITDPECRTKRNYLPSSDELMGDLGDILAGLIRWDDPGQWTAAGRTSSAICCGEGASVRVALSELWLMPEVQAELSARKSKDATK